MNYKRSHLLFWIGLIAGLMVSSSSRCLGVVLILLAFLQARLFYRCPRCGYCLLQVVGPPSRCPGCGKDLS